MFAQRLDFLMKLTNTQNIDLARAIAVDASAVSRLRTGKRKPPKAQSFLPEMCAYFASRLCDEHQKKTAADCICPGRPWPEDTREMSALLHDWFTEDTEQQIISLEKLLLTISDLSFPAAPEPAPIRETVPELPVSHLFYGLGGVKQAMLELLDIALASGQPRTICLFSDENGHWLDGDADFLQSWSLRLKQLIFLGCRVKIIHNTARPQEDLLKGVITWMPLYITGMVETYYYPKVRDGVYHRTVFIAEGLAAMHSSSIDGFSENSLIHLLSDPRGVASLTSEFYCYLQLCCPMIEVICGSEDYAQLLHRYDRLPGNFYLGGLTPSLFTMPEKVAERISYRSGSRDLLALYRIMRSSDFLESGSRSVCELICPPSDRQIYENEIPVGVAKPLGFPNCYYTAEEYKLHLQSIMEYSRLHKNYSFMLTEKIPPNVVIFCKEGEWAIVTKCNRPCVSFASSRPLAVSAITAFFRHLNESSQASFGMRSSLVELMRKLG